MREVVFDTETTGLEPYAGDRLVEIGCVEIVNKIKTGNVFHVYLNPEREVPEAAVKIHGLTFDRLKDEPKFAEIAGKFLEFVGNDKLVAHNAKFDMQFINVELAKAKFPVIPESDFIDTLPIVCKRFSGRHDLNTIAKKFGIDISKRTLHGALLDADILADVYLELCGGRELQFSLDSENIQSADLVSKEGTTLFYNRKKLEPRNLYPLTDEEIAAHNNFLKDKGFYDPLWLKD